MNTETIRIAKLLKRNWQGPMWHGNTVQEILKDINWQMAFNKPPHFSHNIYEYVRHMHCWRRFVIEYLKGNNTYSVEINSEADWVTNYEPTEASWLAALQQLETSQTELVNAFEGFSDEKLEELVPGKKFNWYVMIHGLVHHDIYHSAQIALLKKHN
ncbi:MAG TPA: DinB family protein [Chitinophagales bacterium]|nr:DinB family protein [Chitinophagales bacterium]